MRKVAVLAVATVLLVALTLPKSTLFAQQKSLHEQLVGAWTLVSSIARYPDGRTEDTVGPNPRGYLNLLWGSGYRDDGYFALVIARSDLPKFSSGNRMSGTPEENKAVVQGTIFFFGPYTVNNSERTFTTHVESSSFPNLIGTDQKSSIVLLTADELKYTNPVGSLGPGVVIES